MSSRNSLGRLGSVMLIDVFAKFVDELFKAQIHLQQPQANCLLFP